MSAFNVTGELRIDNRAELAQALGSWTAAGDGLSDAGLVALAYERWGESCAERLIGDFALVAADGAGGRVFAARDALGVRPLYYRVSGETIAFAPTSAGIGEADGRPLELDETRLAEVFLPELEGSDPTGTPYKGVCRLPPGHRLRFERGRTVVSRFWSPEPARELRLSDDRDYAEAFCDVFGEAVRCRMDGSTASMLSGGLDSSAVVGFARKGRIAQGGPPLLTLSAASDDPGCEESRFVRRVASLSRLDPVVIRPADIPSYGAALDGFLARMEAPVDAAMVLPMLMYAAGRRHGAVAVLDGVDGDCVASLEPDFLAGLIRAGRWGHAFREARGVARFYEGTYAPWSSGWRLLARNAARAASPGPARRAIRRLRRPGAIREVLSESILRPEFAARAGLVERFEALWAHRAATSWEPRARHAVELGHPHIAAALERYDRVARSAGIEPRHPFFDKRVVEFCLALPWEQKVRDGWTKRIVRQACEGVIPDEVRWRRGRWVRLGPAFLAAAVSRIAPSLEEVLGASSAELEPFVDGEKLRACIAAWRSGATATGELLWQIAALAHWLRNHHLKEYDSRRRVLRAAGVSRLPVAG